MRSEKPFKDTRLDKETSKESEAVSSYGEYTFEFFKQFYGIIEENNPIVQYVNIILRNIIDSNPEIKDKAKNIKVYISRNLEIKNAFAFSNGAIIISLPLLKIIETEEELAFVIAHELSHILRGKVYELENVEINTVSSIVKALGTVRREEYEADIMSASRLLDRSGYNPLLGANIFNKLKSRESKWSFSYGYIEDRRLNIFSLPYVLDLESIGRLGKPLRPDIKAQIDALKIEELTNQERLSRLLSLDDEAIKELSRRIKEGPDYLTWILISEVMPQWYNEGLVELAMRAVLEDKSLFEKELRSGKVISKLDGEKLGSNFSIYHQQIFSQDDFKNLRLYKQAIDTILSLIYVSFKEKLKDKKEDEKEALAISLITFILYFVLDLPIFEYQAIYECGEKTCNHVPNHEEKISGFALEFFDFHLNDTSLGDKIIELLREGKIDFLNQCLNPELWKYLKLDILFKKQKTYDPIPFLKFLFYLRDELIEIEIDEKELLNMLKNFYDRLGTFLEDFNLSNQITRNILLNARLSAYDYLKKHTSLPEEEIFNSLLGETVKLSEISKKESTKFLLEIFNYMINSSFTEIERDKIRDLLNEYLRKHSKDLSRDFGMAMQTFDFDARMEINWGIINILDGKYGGKYDPDIAIKFLPLIIKSFFELRHFGYQERKVQIAFELLVLSLNDLYEKNRNVKTIEEGISVLYETYSFISDNFYNGNKRWIIDVEDRETFAYLAMFMVRYFKLYRDQNLIWQKIREWYQFLPIDSSYAVPIMMDRDIFDQEFMEEFTKLNEEILSYLYQNHGGDLENLFLLSFFITNFNIKLRFTNYICDKLVKEYDFEKIYQFLLKYSDSIPLYVFDNVIESLAKDNEQFEKIKRLLLTVYEKRSAETFFIFSSLEYIAGRIFSKIYSSPVDFLTAAISSRESEAPLIKFLFKIWFNELKKLNVSYDPSDIDYFTNQGDIEAWIYELSKDIKDHMLDIVTISFILEELYRLDLYGKFLLLRKILVDPEYGILTKAKKEYVRGILNSFEEFAKVFIEDIKDEHLKFFLGILEVILDQESYEQVYFLLSPILTRHILQIPSQRLEKEEILGLMREELSQDFPKEYESSEEYKSSGESELTINGRELGISVDGRTLTTKTDCLEERLYRGAFTSREDLGSSKTEGLIYSELPESYKLYYRSDRMKEVEAIIELANNLGAVGIRFLQLLGQYIDLPPEIEEKFLEVYDRVKGQSKFSAWETILRERPDLLEKFNFGERLGGGSLVSVFLLEEKDGEGRIVLKVLNPNAEYHVKQMIDLARRTLVKLIERDPDNQWFKIILENFLPDLEKWLIDDINDDRFLENDKSFREKWHGRRFGRSKFSIFIPRSFEPNYRYLKLEEYVPGINLTEIKIGETTNFEKKEISIDDYREIISSIIKHYIFQIIDGLVHSDVHKGNYRLTPNFEIAILDRNYYIELQEIDKKFIKSLIRDRNFMESFLDFLLSLEENKSLRNQRDDLLSESRDVDLTDPVSILKILTELKKRGFKIPLRISLLIKNLSSLNNLAKEAGFANIAEAFQYQMSPFDLINFLRQI